MSYLLDQKSKHMSAGEKLDSAMRDKKSSLADIAGAAIRYGSSGEKSENDKAVEERQARAKKSLIESGEDPKKYGY